MTDAKWALSNPTKAVLRRVQSDETELNWNNSIQFLKNWPIGKQ